MKTLFLYGICLVILLSIVAFATGAEWTFMVYLDGDNDLESFALEDFQEMATVGSDTNINIVVLLDRISGGSNAYGDWTDARRGIVMNGNVPDTSWGTSIGEVNMGDPQTLIDFAEWAITNYPANHYALILWNHGAGWREALAKKELIYKEVCVDDTSGDYLSMKEVKNALSTISSSYGRIDLVGFDACLMGMVEVAYQIKDSADVMVSSEETVPGDGWPYHTILADLQSNPTMTPESLGTVIVDRYYEYYSYSEVCSAVALSQMGNLASSINTLAQTIRDNWDTDIEAVKSAAQSTLDTQQDVVIREAHGAPWMGAGGLAIYFPSTSDDFDPDYNGSVIDFPADTVWEEFLSDYYANMTNSWISRIRAQTLEFYYPEHIDLYDFCYRLANYVPPEEYYTESIIPNEFVGGGTAQGWHGDDQTWLLNLPFEFPFFRIKYTSVFVCSNGYLDFENPTPEYESSETGLINNTRIAPLWDNLRTNGTGEDIFITQGEDYVIIRWAAETYWGGSPVNVEVVLYEDGRIKFNYGNGNNFITPVIGISKGNGENYYLSTYNGQSPLSNVDTELWTPISNVIASYSFDVDAEGWQFVGTISPYDSPATGWSPGAISLSPQGSSNCFSFWKSPTVEIEQNKIYRVRWTVGSTATNSDESVDFRLRVNQLGNWRAWETLIYSTSSAAPSASESKTYDLVIIPQMDTPTDNIELSFDILGFDVSNDLNSWLNLEEVSVERVQIVE